MARRHRARKKVARIQAEAEIQAAHIMAAAVRPTQPTLPAPQWATDPWGQAAQRWWDGARWTEHVYPLPAWQEPGVWSQ